MYTSRFLSRIIITFVFLFISGCAGDHLEYDPPDSLYIGKIIHFNNEMAYNFFPNPKSAEDYGFIYPRWKGILVKKIIVSIHTARENSLTLKHYKGLGLEIPDKDMSFKILGSYWQRGSVVKREFAPDVHFFILKDENGILSSYLTTKDMEKYLKFTTDF